MTNLISRRRVLQAMAVLCVLPLSLSSSTLAAQEGPSLVILVRHAEKAAVPGNDPPLSDIGQARAAALAAALHSSPPTAIVTSTLRRTFETSDVVSKNTGVMAQKIAIDGGAAHIAAVAAAVMKQHGVVLVVGHSNTIPAIIKALGGPTLPDICDATYSHFFTLVPAHGAQPAALTISRFGADEPAPPATCAGMVAK